MSIRCPRGRWSSCPKESGVRPTPPPRASLISRSTGAGVRYRSAFEPSGLRRGSAGVGLARGALGVAVGYGHATVAAEGAAGDLDADGRLAALVLGGVHELYHAPDVLLVEAAAHDLAHPLVFLDVCLQDGVEDLVCRLLLDNQMALLEFGRGFLYKDRVRDHLAPLCLVHVAADAVDEGLGDILYNGEPAGHVPVQGGVTDAQLALVACTQGDPTELVGERHDDVPPDPGLDVLLGRVLG